jgi:hypothetical protein
MDPRPFFAFLCGLIAGLVPNQKSNIHPALLGAIFGILFTKIVFGDYDRGYQWTLMDPVFGVVTGGAGALGAYISSNASSR